MLLYEVNNSSSLRKKNYILILKSQNYIIYVQSVKRKLKYSLLKLKYTFFFQNHKIKILRLEVIELMRSFNYN